MKKFFLLISVLLVSLSISSIQVSTVANNGNHSNVEDLAKDYILLMKSLSDDATSPLTVQDEMVLNDLVDVEPGLSSEISSISLDAFYEDSSQKQINGKDFKAIKLDTMRKQKKYLVSLFGEDAVNNITYTIKETSCPQGVLKSFDKKSNSEITEDECEKAGVEYWSKVCAQESIDFDVFYNYLLNGASILNDKYEEIFIKYMNNVPVERRFVDKYETRSIWFAFSGETHKNGKHDFRITAMNVDGNWTIIEDLHATTDIEEPLGD